MPGKKGFGDSRIKTPTYKLAAEGYAPFKMKGSPMQRNFGIGSPAKREESEVHKHEDHHKPVEGEKLEQIPEATMAKKRDHTNPLYDIPIHKAGSPAKSKSYQKHMHERRNPDQSTLVTVHDKDGNVIDEYNKR